MSYKLTRIRDIPKKVNVVQLSLCFEHGDADLTENETFSFGVTEADLDSFGVFCQKIALASDMIDSHRCYSKPLDRELLSTDNQITHGKFSVELPHDRIYSYGVVAMSVNGAVYYDEHGDRYSFDKA